MTKHRWRRKLVVGWMSLWPFIFWCFWTPIPFSSLKIAALGALALAWLGAIMLFPRARLPLAVTSILLAMVGFWRRARSIRAP